MAHAFLTALWSVQVIQRCTKVSFPSRQNALKVLRTQGPHAGLVQAGTGNGQVYRCKTCGGGWHIGHLSGKGRV